MNQIEKSGKTEEDAILEALKDLKIPRSQAKITVLEVGSKGVFGFGAKPFKVLVKVKYDPEQTAIDFLKEATLAIGLCVTIETTLIDKSLYVNIIGDDIGILIGKRGQTLDSMQYLLNLVVNKGNAPFLSVTLDTEHYRKRRKEALEALALNLSKKAKATKKRLFLEPMNPYERRIIHAALQSDKSIETKSEGAEPFRHIVIIPKVTV